MKKLFICLSAICLVSVKLMAQPSLMRMQKNIQALSLTGAAAGIEFKLLSPTQAGVVFLADYTLPATEAKQWVENQLDIRSNTDAFRIYDNPVDTRRVEVQKFQQFFKGIKVEHGIVNITSKAGNIAMMQLEFYSIDDNFNTRPGISERQALQKAIEFTGAEKYSWADAAGALNSPDAPRATLVIVKDYERNDTACLAYKFEINAIYPASAAWVYVHAMNGKVLLNDNQIKHFGNNRIRGENNFIQQAKTSVDNETPERLNPVQESFNQQILLPPTDLKNPPPVYANVEGSAATKFNGIQFLYCDNNSGIAGKPYRLRSTRNNTNIETYDFNNKNWNSTVDHYPTALEIVDNDNNWTAAEFNNSRWEDAGPGVQFNMQVISDYWWTVHGRKSWDNANSPIKGYVHVFEFVKVSSSPDVYNSLFMRNAFWFKGRISYGDGSNSASSLPYTSFDICAHELGHAITETTSQLVYQWESGALNEAFSDIWAACITDYAKRIYNMPDEITWRMGDKSENVGFTNQGYRDMANPPLYSDPSAYKNYNWKPASLETCRDFATQDNCGVHSNSGVLNKWFFLITQGQTGTNTFGTPFSIAGLGFPVSEQIAYLTSANLTPNASYQTCRTVSLNATATLFGNNSAAYQTVWDAWVAVAVDSNVFNMSNTPVFTTNNFTTIAVGKNGVVLAGTNYNGLYKFANNTWEKLPELTDVRFNDIKADYKGDFWMAQSGKSGTVGGGSSIGGGVSLLKTPFTGPSTLFTVGAQTDVPSRNGRCMYIDTFRTINLINPSVWVATTSYISSSASKSGMLGHGQNLLSPAFTNVSGNINTSSGTAGCLTVGGSKNVIWTFVQANNGINQLLTYDAESNVFLQSFDHNSHPTIPSGFVARSIYCDARGRTWVGLANGGLLVYDERNSWHVVDFPLLFPTDTQASFNALTGNKEGDVYIGTTTGLVYFERGDGLPDKIDQLNSYKVFGKANGLPSNTINAMAYDTLRFKLLVATDSGVIFWEPLCINPYCNLYAFTASVDAETIAAGNWNNPAIWNTGKIPDSATNVSIKHAVTVNIDGVCKGLSVKNPAALTVQSGKHLIVFSQGSNTIFTGTQQRRRRR